MLRNNDVDALSSRCKFIRLKALKRISQTISEPINGDNANLQIHTNNSFSPYTPSLAVFMAYKFGIRLCGLCDNYTLRGADEFIKACKMLNLTYSVGVELRADFNFLEIGSANVLLLGIAQRFHKQTQEALRVFRENQKGNIEATCLSVNKKIKRFGFTIDVNKDVLKVIPKNKDRVLLSKYVFFALANKLVKQFDATQIENFVFELGIKLEEDEKALLSDFSNQHYVYDLANVLFEHRDSFFPKKKYAPAKKIVELGRKVGAISVVELQLKNMNTFTAGSIKRLESVLNGVKSLGFDGVCFDANKLDAELRQKLFEMLKQMELLPFALNEVEFPRQQFTSSFPDELSKKVMTESAYTVVGSEMCENISNEGFVNCSLKTSDFAEKVNLFSKIGKGE